MSESGKAVGRLLTNLFSEQPVVLPLVVLALAIELPYRPHRHFVRVPGTSAFLC
jgi:hypothetical protein